MAVAWVGPPAEPDRTNDWLIACVYCGEVVNPGFRSSWSHVGLSLGVDLREWVEDRNGSCAYAAAAVREGSQAGSNAETRGGGSMESAW
jgi:hypothetical protein